MYRVSFLEERYKLYIVIASVINLIGFLVLLGCGSWWYCSIFAFAIGLVLGNIADNKCFSVGKNSLGVLIVEILILLSSYMYAKCLNLHDGIVFLGIKVLHSILSCTMCYQLNKVVAFNGQILKFLGKNSYIIYLTHPLLLRMIRAIFEIKNNAFILFITVCFTTVIFTKLYCILKKGKRIKVI